MRYFIDVFSQYPVYRYAKRPNELNEYLTSFKYLISCGSAIANPTLEPASERDFENVCTTMTLSYLSIRGRALSPPKSIYASSTTTMTS